MSTRQSKATETWQQIAAEKRRERVEAMRGRSHEKTLEGWASHLGVSPRTIQGDLKELGESPKGKPLKGERKEKMRGRAHTKTLPEWAEELGCAEKTVKTYLSELKESAKLRPNRGPEGAAGKLGREIVAEKNAQRRQMMAKEIAAYEGERSVADWAAHLRCSRETVKRVLAEMGRREMPTPQRPAVVEDYTLSLEWLRKPIMCPRKAKQLAEAYEAEGLV